MVCFIEWWNFLKLIFLRAQFWNFCIISLISWFFCPHSYQMRLKEWIICNAIMVSPCVTVSFPFSQSQGRFFISHGFTNFEQIFSPNYLFIFQLDTIVHYVSENITAEYQTTFKQLRQRNSHVKVWYQVF